MGEITSIAAVDINESIVLPLDIQPPLIAPTIIGATIYVSIPITNGTTVDESGAHYNAPPAETFLIFHLLCLGMYSSLVFTL